jgi:FlaA1/EpsC-like NDP-sugar epimerase
MAMIEPVKLADFFITFFSAASVIIFGALYALLFAYSRIKKVPRVMLLAYASYAALFVSVMVLANVANLFGSRFWQLIVLLMLVGYLLAPRFIYRLCVATHEEVSDDTVEKRHPDSSLILLHSVSSSTHQPRKEKAL